MSTDDSSGSDEATLPFHSIDGATSHQSLLHALRCVHSHCPNPDCKDSKHKLLHAISCQHQDEQTNCPYDANCNTLKHLLASSLTRQAQATESAVVISMGGAASMVSYNDPSLPGDQESRDSVARFARWILDGIANALSLSLSLTSGSSSSSPGVTLHRAREIFNMGDRDPTALWVHMLSCPYLPNPSPLAADHEQCDLDVCRGAKKIILHRLTCADSSCWLCCSICLPAPVPASSSSNDPPPINVQNNEHSSKNP